MTSQDNTEISFTAADCDGLSLVKVIRKFVIGPDEYDMGMVVGALRTDGWVWLRITNAEWYAEQTDADDGPDFLEVPSGNVYPIDQKDGTFVADPGDLAEIERDGIEGHRCERLSGAALRAKQKNWLRLLFEADPRWGMNIVGVLAGDFIWTIDLTIEDILPAIHSLAKLAENVLSVTTLRPVARGVVKRWNDLIDLLRRGELVAIGMKSGRRERLSAQLWSGDRRVYIDLLTGNCGTDIRSGGELTVDWSDLHLWVSEADSAPATIKPKMDDGRVVPIRGQTSVREVPPRSPQAPDETPMYEAIAARARERGTPGRREAYDWAALKKPLAVKVGAHGRFAQQTDLVNWCIENVRLRPGAQRPKGGGIDAKTVKAAIHRHSLDKIGLSDPGAIGEID